MSPSTLGSLGPKLLDRRARGYARARSWLHAEYEYGVKYFTPTLEHIFQSLVYSLPPMSTQRTHARVLRENELTASPRVSLLFNAHLSPISCHLSAPLLSLSLCICSPLRLWTGSPPAPPGPLSPSPFRPSPFIKMVLREPIGPKPFHKMVSASLSRRFPEELAALGDNVGLTVGEPLATPAQACRVEKMRSLQLLAPHLSAAP